MTEKPIISGTIVLYKNNLSILKKTVRSFLDIALPKILYLVDNSPTDVLKNTFIHPDVRYIFVGKNIGFGKAHNSIINKIANESWYHLVLNPDVIFSNKVVPNLVEVLKKEPDVAVIAPKVLYNNGDHQYTSRKYPSILELMGRRIRPLGYILRERIMSADYRDRDLEAPFYVEYLTGCFLLFRTKDYIEINGFDERYFLYMEDVDICRKLDAVNKKKLYYPNECIYHRLERGSTKKIKLFFHHISSVFQYFYKWGVKNKKSYKKND